MYCPSCGEEITESSAYCQYCGAEVSEDDAAEDWGTESDAWGTEPADRDRGVDRTGTAAGSSTDSTTLAALTHVLALFTWVIGPAVVLLASDDAYVRENARNAVNWQISFTIYMLVSIVLAVIVIGIFTAMLLALLDLVFCIVAAVKASDGDAWNYPLTIDFV